MRRLFLIVLTPMATLAQQSPEVQVPIFAHSCAAELSADLRLARFLNFAKKSASRFNQTFVQELAQIRDNEANPHARRLWESMIYSLEAGGKRVRPLLVAMTGRFYGIDAARLDPIARAVEMLHTSSLIFDDLPSMDNEVERRGRLTNHLAFDEATAILGGLSLIAQAGVELTRISDFGFADSIANQVHRFAFSRIPLLASGQLRDLRETNTQSDPIRHEEMTYLKTGLGLETSIVAVAMLAGASDLEVRKWKEYSRLLGRIFQLKDDLLDVEGNPLLLGKSVGNDLKNHTTTHISIFGLAQSRQLLDQLRAEAIHALSGFDPIKRRNFELLVDYIATRDR